jgi:ankyrin repeat protein
LVEIIKISGTMPTAEKSGESDAAPQQKPVVRASMLIEYIRKGSLEDVKTAVGLGASVNKLDENWGYSPLMFAARDNMPEIAKFLLSNQADIFVRDPYNETILAKAAAAGANEIVDLLLEQVDSKQGKYVFVNSTDKNGFSPLMCAAMNGKTDTVEKLIQHGAVINLANANSDTAAHLAATWGHQETVVALQKLGADLTMRNDDNLDVQWTGYANGHWLWLRGSGKRT